jgi:hypothetical protein
MKSTLTRVIRKYSGVLELDVMLPIEAVLSSFVQERSVSGVLSL